MLIEVLGWAIVGIGVLGITTQAVSLSPAPRPRPRRPGQGRHSKPESEPVFERAKPEERSKEWRRLRVIVVTALFGPAILLNGTSSKPFNPAHDPAKWLVLAATAVVVIWELRSWRQFTDQADRQNAFRSARVNLVPAAAEVFVLLGGWRAAPERIGFVIAIALLVVGPDIESWIRRRLQRRAGGTTAT